VATTFVTIVGWGTRAAFACSYDCFSTVMRPPDASAALRNSAYNQSRAAPMPRFGSFCSDNVLRVPKETSFLIVASMLRASISRTMFEMARLRTGAALRAGCLVCAATNPRFAASKKIITL